MKKTLIGLTALTVFVLSAGMALAGCYGPMCYSGGQTNIGNSAYVSSSVSATSVTGANYIGNSSAYNNAFSGICSVGGNSISTGAATSTANSATLVNSNVQSGWMGGSQTNLFNSAYVGNTVGSVAETGFNAIGNSSAEKYALSGVGGVSNNTIRTGAATSTANSATLVNSNVQSSWMGSSQTNLDNHAFVGNSVDASSVTGANNIGNSSAENHAGSFVGGVYSNTVTTGTAASNVNSVLLVNSNVTRGWSY